MKAGILGFVAALAVSVFSPANASVIYTYTGHPMSGLACPSTCSITGSFTVAGALAPNLDSNYNFNAFHEITNITPIAFSFTDGTNTLTQSDSLSKALFVIGTDSTGAIDKWLISIVNSIFTIQFNIDAPSASGVVFDQIAGGNALNRGVPGTWSVSETPLPSTWLMLLSGFVGLGFFAYRGSKKNAAAIAAA